MACFAPCIENPGFRCEQGNDQATDPPTAIPPWHYPGTELDGDYTKTELHIRRVTKTGDARGSPTADPIPRANGDRHDHYQQLDAETFHYPSSLKTARTRLLRTTCRQWYLFELLRSPGLVVRNEQCCELAHPVPVRS